MLSRSVSTLFMSLPIKIGWKLRGDREYYRAGSQPAATSISRIYRERQPERAIGGEASNNLKAWPGAGREQIEKKDVWANLEVNRFLTFVRMTSLVGAKKTAMIACVASTKPWVFPFISPDAKYTGTPAPKHYVPIRENLDTN